MKKIIFLILFFVIFSGYAGNNSKKEYIDSSALNYEAGKEVLSPLKEVSSQTYNNIVTDDFKHSIKLAVEGSLGAARILFVNVLDTAIDALSDVYIKTKDIGNSSYLKN